MENKYQYDIVLDRDTVERKEASHTLILRQIKEGARVLECGPGGGIMTRYLKEVLRCSVTILEIDEASFETSMQYADAGFRVNLEEDDWLTTLEDESFDYIMYADVLEHLHNPTEVLKKMQRFLKQDGRVVLSVPNVAHGDIIMNLLRDRFTYLPLGLLDNTHVHLFAYDSLHTMIKDAGYYTEYETCVTVPLFRSEQSQFLSDEDRGALSNTLLQHPTRYAYQFISVLSKEPCEIHSDVLQCNQKLAENDRLLFPTPKICRATCFFDMGDGYTPESCEVCRFTASDHIELSFQVPADAKRIRFDPVEGCGCVLRNLEIVSDQGTHNYRNINGTTIEDLEVFCTKDPQLEVVFTYLPASLTFRYELLISRDSTLLAMMSSSESLEHAKVKIEKELAEKKKELAEKEKELAGKERELDGKVKELKSAEGTMTKMRKDSEEKEERLNSELTYYKDRYHASAVQNEQLKAQVRHWRTSYDVISNSATWKATKPVRVTLDKLKKNYAFRMVDKGLRSWKDNGFNYTYNKALDKVFPQRMLKTNAKKQLLSDKEKAVQRVYKHPQKIKISIVVPLHNTRDEFLRGMIQSVIDQTYRNWELYLADGSDESYRIAEHICRNYAAKDRRIHYCRMDGNGGTADHISAALKMATGTYIGFLNQEDQLHPAALYEFMRAACDKNADFVYTDECAFRETVYDAFRSYCKPDFAPDSLRGNNYIGRFFLFSTRILQKAGGVNAELEKAWEYDLVLRLTEQAEKIVHVSKILYFSCVNSDSAAENGEPDPETVEETCRVLDAHLRRVGLNGKAEGTAVENIYRIRYELQAEPLISILIPNYEHLYDLKICVDSIYAISTYSNFEVVIVENNSSSKEIFDYYEQLQQEHSNLKVVRWEGHFNYSAICNFGAEYCTGEYLLLLNNDIEVITPDWMQEMLMYAQRPDVGAVGAMLYYPDNTVQHGGVGIGIRGVADHLHRYADRDSHGYMNRLVYAQNLSAVTAACMMLRTEVWKAVNGLDEKYEVAFNDVDLCMRIRECQKLILWTPFAELYHYESKSRGYEDTAEKKKRFLSEKQRFMTRWKKELNEGDPYLNPNFTLDRSDFTIKPGVIPAQAQRGSSSLKEMHLALIKNSPYFDAEWYMNNNLDLQGKIKDPALHYLNYGGFELRDPSEAFSSEEYYALNEDVRKAKVNPLLHYELSGKWENRDLYGFEETELVFPEGTIATEREFKAAPVLHRRTVILSSFFADGKVSETLLYLIRGLREVADQIIIIGDCLIFPEELDKLDGLVVYAKFERHYQYDFGSYKRGMKYARDHGYLDEAVASELVFINDSCYGPVFPFAETFEPMTRKKIDYWGYVILKSAYKNHISTYFLDFKRNIIDSMLLDEFLERVQGTYDRGRVIATLETELTQYLHDHGFRYEAIVNTTKISFFNHPVTLLKKYRVPLVKKKAFTRKGLENQQEALEIIKENAPELAELIHYKPFVPKKHHFPTIEEHLKDCEKTCRTIAQKVNSGEKIRALFLIFNAFFFPSKPLFIAMLHDELFDPFIAIIPDRRWGAQKQIPEMDNCENALVSEGLPSQRIIRAQKDELDRWSDVCRDMDIVCYNSPYNLSFYRYLPRYSMGRSFLPVMVNYGFYRSVYDDKLLSLKNYEYMWKAFFECEDTLAQYKRNSAIGGKNGDIVGYVKMDPLSTVKVEKHERKRVLVALHHSVEGGINEDLELGNMIRYSDYFLSLPDRFPEIDFVYRPHPHLFQVVVLKNLWSEEKVEKYIQTLKSKPNVIWSSGQDYFKEFAESDGCIQDCGSFLVEYLYTGKPCCYMLKHPSDIEQKFAPLGKKCLEQCYISYDTDAIDRFMEDVIIGGKDEKAEARRELSKKVMVNYPHAAEAALESIKRGIFGDDYAQEPKSR